jgi:hypothetical protein
MRRLVSGLVAALLVACAGAPALRDPSRSGVYGYLRLRPHEGAAPAPTAGAPKDAYGDRRYADTGLVDYSRPGFAVVYLERGRAEAAPSGTLAIRAGAGGVAIDPPHAATSIGAGVELRNLDGVPHVVSVPAAGLVRALAPGDRLLLPADRPGPLEVFVPGASAGAAIVFVAPGPFAAVSEESGRFEILEVAPGPNRIGVWHPRLPPATRDVALAAGSVARVDLEIGVGRSQETEIGSRPQGSDAR